DEEACKDIVQEVFLSVWTDDELVKIENAKAYFHQAVRYKVLMELRRGKVSEKHLQTLQLLEVNSTEELFNFQELNETIENTIQTLPEKCREVFVLSRMEHLSNKEIAERMNISIRTVETHISNALRILRFSLDGSTALLIVLFFT
ncbi:MAG: RNA polymerase sigma-70 factor, partial [Bacteroidota bacterium]